MDKLKHYFKEHQAQMKEEYFQFLRIPSISTDPDYKAECKHCFDWLSQYIKAMGFDVEEWPTKGHPVLFAARMIGPDKPTVMIYHHYDVQPATPLDEWDSPPFEPVERKGEIYARGAQDNKGQCFYSLQAIKALLSQGELPVNLKLCIEGEEEGGSNGLIALAHSKQKQLTADYLIVPDSGIKERTQPAITVGIRGVVTMTVTLQEALVDSHSGHNGGLLYNPIRALCELISKLWTADGKVAVPGFYDDALSLTEDDKKHLDLEFDEKQFKKLYGVNPTGGEKGYSPLERSWARPVLEINGIKGGYADEGFKTVIPAKAIAKISCRLVPDQDPEKIRKRVIDFLKKHTPEGMTIEFDVRESGGYAMRTSFDATVITALKKAYEEVFKKPCKLIMSGGSINVVRALADHCHNNVAMVGLGLDDDNIHAPNEHFGWDRFEQGFQVIARALQILGESHIIA